MSTIKPMISFPVGMHDNKVGQMIISEGTKEGIIEISINNETIYIDLKDFIKILETFIE